jgi:hypothetical protein
MRKYSSEYFRDVTEEHEKIFIRIFSSCTSGGSTYLPRHARKILTNDSVLGEALMRGSLIDIY